MMKKIDKAVFWLLYVMVFSLLFTGCHSQKKKKAEKLEEMGLYYVNNEENGLVKVEREIKKIDNKEDKIKEILRLLAEGDKDGTEDYKASIYDGQIIRDVSVESNEATIDYESNYKQLSSDKEILMRSAVVKSLVQLDGIDQVTFTVSGDSLMGKDDIAIGAMTKDSFLDENKDLYTHKEVATLYFADKDSNQLVAVSRDVSVSDNTPVDTGLLNELINGKAPKGCINPLPKDLTINKTLVYNNICYVDLGGKIEEIHPELDDKVKIYAMVNTLVDRGYVSQVQFSVDGKPMAKLNDIENFDQPFTCDYSLVKESKNKEKKKK